jgi:hypothetical protein
MLNFRARDAVTADRGYFAPIEAGKTRRLTPEGYLICEDVAIARTGEQVYAAADLPGLTPDADGKIYVTRSPDEVFADETIASFEGKAVTVFHPSEFVNPENHKQLAVGHLQNVRRGEGPESNLLKGDIVITDAAAIQYAMQALPDISCGYDAQYKQSAPGRASQHDIRGNHAALVPNGRAGERCAIKDSATERPVMTPNYIPPFSRPAVERIAPARRMRDERLDPMTSGQTISRGTYWDGTGVNPKLDEKVGPIRDFVSGFIPGNVVGAESPGTVIDLGRVYLPRVQDEELRQGLARAMDEAEEEWKKDARSGMKVTEDAARRPTGRLPIHAAAARHTVDKVAFLNKHREELTVRALYGSAGQPSVNMTPAAIYAANLAAGRAKREQT